MTQLDLYTWSGSWGPFKINSHCEECTVAYGLLKKLAEKYPNIVNFQSHPWLNNWFKIFLKGGYHPPITFVDGKLFHQYSNKDPLPDISKLEEEIAKLKK